MSRAVEYVLRTPWAITQDGLETILAVASRENRPVEAIEREMGRPLEKAETVRVRDGVATIPVAGPLTRYANLFSRVSGATSLEALSTDLESALAEPGVGAVVLSIDSPGGQVPGTDELAELIYRARERKPVIAHISGIGASAAYWLASAATEVVVAPTALVGSIGAVLSLRVYEEKEDSKRIEFVSSVSPRKNPHPESAEGAEDIQAVVDAIGEEFVSAVARYRGVTPDAVKEKYGQGRVFVGQAAVDAGLADRVGILEDVIGDLSQGRRAPAPNLNNGRAIMPNQNKAGAVALTADEIREFHPEAAEQIATAAATAAAQKAESTAWAKGFAEGRAAAMEIMGTHAPGLEDLRAELAADPDVMPLEAASRILAALAERSKAQGDAFRSDRIRGEKEAPQPTASSENQDGALDSIVNRVLATEASLTSGGA